MTVKPWCRYYNPWKYHGDHSYCCCLNCHFLSLILSPFFSSNCENLFETLYISLLFFFYCAKLIFCFSDSFSYDSARFHWFCAGANIKVDNMFHQRFTQISLTKLMIFHFQLLLELQNFQQSLKAVFALLCCCFFAVKSPGLEGMKHNISSRRRKTHKLIFVKS